MILVHREKNQKAKLCEILGFVNGQLNSCLDQWFRRAHNMIDATSGEQKKWSTSLTSRFGLSSLLLPLVLTACQQRDCG